MAHKNKPKKTSAGAHRAIIAINPIIASSYFDLATQQFLSDWIDPTQLSTIELIDCLSGSIRAIQGNLLAALSEKLQPIEISHIDNIPLHFLEETPGSGIAHIHKSASHGELRVFCRATPLHPAGDFIYTLGTQAASSEFMPKLSDMNAEIFSYTLLDKNHKQITLQLTIQLSEEDIHIELPNLGLIQEEDLIMGGLAKTRGVLPNLGSGTFKFLPINQQYSLKSSRIMANHQALVYELSEHGQKLMAKQAHGDLTVFSAKLDPKGLYDFELHHPIDRPSQSNLMSANFKCTPSSLYQDIQTQRGKIYELSFYFKPIKTYLIAQNLPLNQPISVELWWAGLLIGVIQLLAETLKGYHFTLEGQDESTRLELKLPEQALLLSEITTQNIAEHLDLATIVPEEKKQVTFELGIENETGKQAYFPITLDLDNEILVSQAASYTITIEDLSPYKKIVLSNHIIFDAFPATNLNLEKIFDHMQIPESQRHVEVAQIGHSAIYEIKISDKSDLLAMPVTIADVELKFDGGNTGLDTLFKYLSIDI